MNINFTGGLEAAINTRDSTQMTSAKLATAQQVPSAISVSAEQHTDSVSFITTPDTKAHTSRLLAIKSAIENGSYYVPASAVATALLNRIADNGERV